MLGKAFATLTVIAAVALAAVSGAAPAPAQPAPTVLTLAPAFFPMPSNLLRGEEFAGAAVVVPYVNILAAPNVNSGADILNDMLHTTEGQVLVVGYSEGAEVADAWLRRYGPTSDVDSARVSFLLVGDPEAAINGCISVGNYPGVGLHDLTNRSTQAGNSTYMTAWTFPVPAAAQDGDDATLRPQIESGYQRGYVMP